MQGEGLTSGAWATSDSNVTATASFQADAAHRSARATILVTLVCGVLLLGWSVGDFDFFPEHALRFLLYRVVATTLCGLLAALAWYAQTTHLKYAAIWLWFVVWGAVNAVMIPSTPEYMMAHILVLVISQIASPAFIVWPWTWGVTKSLALLVIGEVALSQGDFDGYNAFAAHAYLLTGVAFSALGTRVRYRAEFVQYQTQAQLAEALHRAREVDRLKNEFFANISHELRTPLTLILSPVDALLSKLGPSAERDALKVVRRNATRLLRMIDDLLDLARLEAGGLRLRVMQVDMDQLAKRAAGNAAPAAKAKGIELAFSSEGEPVELFGDPHRIEIILANLVGNAMKFTPPGGRIEVSVFHNSAGASVEVSDTGPGIAKDEQQRIFDRFHQTETSERRRAGGVGIGLALARELAQLHSGSLTVNSELGQGSTFTLFLQSGKEHFHTQTIERRQVQVDVHPSRRFEDRSTADHTRPMEDATAEIRQSERAPERVLLDRGRVPRVLVAEDEDDLRGFIVGVLSESYHVDAAKDGAEALELIKEDRPDLVLTDVMMPGTSGLDLCRVIKGNPSLRQIPARPRSRATKRALTISCPSLSTRRSFSPASVPTSRCAACRSSLLTRPVSPRRALWQPALPTR